MKLNNIFKGLLATLMAVGMASCADDYLDLKPITSVTATTVSNSDKGAKAGIYGICNSMNMQYGRYDSYFFSGEASLNALLGEVYGQDWYNGFWAARFGSDNFAWAWMRQSNYIVPTLAWMYCYGIIGQCNEILNGIDEATGEEANLAFLKAQALTLRSHAYHKLLQVYAPRWEDSNNGEKYCIVLRLVPGEIEVPLVRMNEVLNQIYSDLDLAIELYKSSGQKRTYEWEPDLSIAQGVYARVAILKHDWAKAKEMAHAARQNYPIMTAAEYKQGFCRSNKEWMWCNPCEFDGIYYWAFGSVYACNGAYPVGWQLGAGAINYELYRQMDTKDIRRDLFWTPDKRLMPGLKPSDFWNKAMINPSNMDMNALKNLMFNSLRSWCKKSKPVGGESFPPAYADPKKNELEQFKDNVIPFGAHVKFWGVDEYGTGSFPYMRGAEMLLIEAEAAAETNDATTAQKCLEELNANRIDGYTCTLTGSALVEEVRLNRRIELWGEGFNFFDFKRWNIPIVRKPWIEGDPNSNNIPSIDAKELQPEDKNGWVYIIPKAETQYNKLVDESLVR